MSYALMEIGLHLWGPEHYAVDRRFNRPGSEADPGVEQLVRPLADLRAEAFAPLLAEPREYGTKLWKAVFDEQGAALYAEAAAAAAQMGVPLRLRLAVGVELPQVHELHWETLCNPAEAGGAPLFLREDVLFSRYVVVGDARPVPPWRRDDPRALVVVANPSDLGRYRPGNQQLAPIDVRAEVGLAEAVLDDVSRSVLASRGEGTPEAARAPTLDNVLDELRRDGGCDVLYLVCHGALLRGEPRLWLEDDDDGHHAEVVSGTELAQRVRELKNRPRLAVLVSCQSAGGGEGDALAALGPRLAQAGVPAVLAMQGNVSMETMRKFLPAFFRELRRDGQLDRAVAVARGTVRDRADCWMPVLYTRLNSGRLWGHPEVAQGAFDWNGLLGFLEAGKCTPILGPGVNEHVLGPYPEIAQRWADIYRIPMAPYYRDDLPQIAQYLSAHYGPAFPRTQLEMYLRREIVRRFRGRVPDLPVKGPLPELVRHVGAWLRATRKDDPHTVLAQLRQCPLYITTTPDGLMADALAEAGRTPRVGTFDWRGNVLEPEEAFPMGYQPDRRQPLVYHLFGDFNQQRLMVLSQDEYFEYLIGATRHSRTIPTAVRARLNASALLFLGFRLDDWKFRVLLQSIRNGSGQALADDYTHVAVQIDPAGGSIQDPEQARRYLEKLGMRTRISVFTGSLDVFLTQLRTRAADRQPGTGDDSWPPPPYHARTPTSVHGHLPGTTATGSSGVTTRPPS